MIDKFVPDIPAALAGIEDGAIILVGGFGTVGIPNALIEGLVALRSVQMASGFVRQAEFSFA